MLKISDSIRIVGNSSLHEFYIGEIAIVTDIIIKNNNIVGVMARHFDGHLNWFVSNEDFEVTTK